MTKNRSKKKVDPIEQHSPKTLASLGNSLGYLVAIVALFVLIGIPMKDKYFNNKNETSNKLANPAVSAIDEYKNGLIKELIAVRKEQKLTLLSSSMELDKAAELQLQNYIAGDYKSTDIEVSKTGLNNAGYKFGELSVIVGRSSHGFKQIIDGFKANETTRKGLFNTKAGEFGYALRETNPGTFDVAFVFAEHLVSGSVTSSPSMPQNSQTQDIKPYTPGVCTKIPIPFVTRYEDASWLEVGTTSVWQRGQDGIQNKCTPDSMGKNYTEYTVKASDRVIYVGTKPKQSTPGSSAGTSGISYQQAVNNCNAIGATSNTSAHIQCLQAYGY